MEAKCIDVVLEAAEVGSSGVEGICPTCPYWTGLGSAENAVVFNRVRVEIDWQFPFEAPRNFESRWDEVAAAFFIPRGRKVVLRPKRNPGFIFAGFFLWAPHSEPEEYRRQEGRKGRWRYPRRLRRLVQRLSPVSCSELGEVGVIRGLRHSDL